MVRSSSTMSRGVPGRRLRDPEVTRSVSGATLLVGALLLGGCTTGDDPEAKGATTDEIGTTLGSTIATTSVSVTTVVGCGEAESGLSPKIAEPGPVAFCSGSTDPVENTVVLARPGVTNAEDAFAALATGLTEEERARGYESVLPDRLAGDIVVTRTDPNAITVQLPETIADINNLSTSTVSAFFRVQLLGTAFSDPTVHRVDGITVEGFGSVCGLMESEPDCVIVTRDEFFTELQRGR